MVSHHSLVFAHVYRCVEKGIEVTGVDHISAKFTGLSATVSPGDKCKGIFVTLNGRNNEMYSTTPPIGNIVGWLRGSLLSKVLQYDPKKHGDKVGTWRLKDIPKSCNVVASFHGN
ncbi:hypothetical protein FBU59_005275 [Linderina macrospora]|uniref:Uncharacterized protein n=1 Tax=Linderina macrospora TaxID=4868 RepID=A0ACC1J328_9FUNG|nr:hypothetical protein FBU59_005275 [Linderina macrospora]